MSATFRIILLLFIVTVLAIPSSHADSKQLANQLNDVAKKLDQATFQPVRRGWAHDYGFQRGTGMLNTFEYLRSLMTYEQLQSQLPMAIFTSGPHSKTTLNLRSEQSFGHYNPEFVSYFHSTVNQTLKLKGFISSTQNLFEKTGILEKFERLYHIHQYIEKNRNEYLTFKSSYQTMLAAGKWPDFAYRELLPKEMLDHDHYWNWSETVYYFWIRRDIDGTKELWFGLINDVLDAYQIDKSTVLQRMKKKNNY